MNRRKFLKSLGIGISGIIFPTSFLKQKFENSNISSKDVEVSFNKKPSLLSSVSVKSNEGGYFVSTKTANKIENALLKLRS